MPRGVKIASNFHAGHLGSAFAHPHIFAGIVQIGRKVTAGKWATPMA